MQFKPKSIFEAASTVLFGEAKEYFMLRQRKYPEFRVVHYSANRRDVSSKGAPQKFTKDAAQKALTKFDYYGDYEAVPWVEK